MARRRRRRRPPQNRTNPTKVGVDIKLGTFTADSVRLKEARINHLVLRVNMEGVKMKHTPTILRSRFGKFGSFKAMIQHSFRQKFLTESNAFCKPKETNKIVKRYYLKFPPLKYTHSRVTVDFEKFSDQVCNMKLPSHLWKVKVMMNTNLSAMYYFSNHRRSRSVAFSESNPYFKITIDGIPVILLGCPKTVSSIQDMEVLLDIVNSISLKDCMNLAPPFCILLLVTYSYFAYVVLYCLHATPSSSRKYASVAIYHLLLLMFLWSFLATVFARHDPVPPEYCLTASEHLALLDKRQEEIDTLLKKVVFLRKLDIYTCTETGQIRYCKECHLIKPDRSHHCSTCQRCILKMDHHCPWVANCVGFANYKQFLLTLFYALLWCLFCIASTVDYILDLSAGFNVEEWFKMVIVIGFAIFGLSTLLVAVLLLYHLALLHRNVTTLEDSREPSFRQDSLTFDMGGCNNFLQVFGNNCCVWLLPTFSALGTGYEFPVNNIYTAN